jgi:hypothetical protein
MRVAWLFLASSTLLMAGCSVSKIATDEPVASPTPTAEGRASITGIAHGGRQPIVGAKIYMYAVTIGAYGQKSTSLMLPTADTQQDAPGNPYYVLTGPGGRFSIGAFDYSCTSSGETAVYLYSQGGNPGTSSDNPNAGLMAVLGACTAATASTGGGFPSVSGSIVVNEVTTVATAYALAGFATDATDMSGGTTSEGPTDVANAANSAFNLASLTNLVSGTSALATTPAGNGTVPQTEINTLADILAACVNEIGSACTTIFNAVKSNGTTGSSATDTATAAIYMAKNPWANTSLYSLATATSPFQNAFTSAPNDWTIAITYTGNGLSDPVGVAVDGLGNAWIASNGNNTISEFGPTGSPLNISAITAAEAGAQLAEPEDVAIDLLGNVWVVNANGTNISEFNVTDGTVTGGAVLTDSNLSLPFYLAIDGSSNIWVTNSNGPTVTEFVSGGSSADSEAGAGGLNSPQGVAIDSFGNVWVANNPTGNSSITEFPGGNLTEGVNFPGNGSNGLNGAQGVAVDGQGDIWVANTYDVTLTEFSPVPGPGYSPAIITGGGLNGPWAIAIDGAGNVWATNYPDTGTGSGSLSEFTSAGVALSPNSYIGSAVLSNPVGIAIDGSGNVWVANPSSGGPPDNLIEFVGAAVPVVAPLSVGVKNNSLGTRP